MVTQIQNEKNEHNLRKYVDSVIHLIAWQTPVSIRA